MAHDTDTASLNDVVDVIFVGAAMKGIATDIMDKDVPVRARHMACIDDLLYHVEDNDVECAVIDQSSPTESRGIKLVLLASIKKVRRLIVIGSPAGKADIAAIDGVHQVLSGPTCFDDIQSAILTRTQHSIAQATVAADDPVADRPVDTEATEQHEAFRLANLRSAISTIVSLPSESAKWNWQSLLSRLQSRQVVAGVAAAFVCMSALATLSLVMDGSAVVARTANTSAHTTTQATPVPRTEITVPRVTHHEPGRTVSALETAAATRHHAALRLEGSMRTIKREIQRQVELREDVEAVISGLKVIVTDLTQSLRAAGGRQTEHAGSLAGHRQLAKAKIELALQELELGRIDSVLASLNLLKSNISLQGGEGFKLAEMGSHSIGK